MLQNLPNKAFEWANVILGVLLVLAPFALGFAAETYAAWNAWILGAAIIVIAGIAIAQYGQWADWLLGIGGLWLIIAPFALGFSGLAAAMWTHVILGLAVAIVSGVHLYIGDSGNMAKAHS